MNHYASPKEDYTQDINESSAYLPKRRRNFKPKRVASMLVGLVMIVGLAAGAVLVQENQDIRQRAASFIKRGQQSGGALQGKFL